MARTYHPNAYKWLTPPTIEQINVVVSASGASETKFEIFHGIYPGCIAQVRLGFRSMPLKHWHLFLSEDTQKPISKPISQTIHKPVQKIPATPRPKRDSRLSNLL